jgi:hypothetical protein
MPIYDIRFREDSGLIEHQSNILAFCSTMVPIKITYQKLRELIETLDPAHPEYSFQIRNLQAMVLLVELTPAQQQHLNIWLYSLERSVMPIQAARSKILN